jgi:hypothetical protein
MNAVADEKRCRSGGRGGLVHRAHEWKDGSGTRWRCPGFQRCGDCLRQGWADLLERDGTRWRCATGPCARRRGEAEKT